MNFSHPELLILLPLAFIFLRRKKPAAIIISSLESWCNAEPPYRIKWLPVLRWLKFFAAALLILALAGPRTARPVAEEIRQGIAIELLVDISSSMDQNITKPDGEKTSRLNAAKKVVEEFIGGRSDDLLGLITFARYADTLSPLTFGHDALIQLVREIKIQDRPNEDGTAYGDALALACAGLHKMHEWLTPESEKNPAAHIQSKIVVLLTDGENNCGLHLPQEAGGFAKEWNIRVYAISIGNSGDAGELTGAEKLLQFISCETGGNYWKISDAGELNAVYEEIDRLEKNEIRTATFVHTKYKPAFQFFAVPALLLFFTALLLSSTVLRIAQIIN